MCRNGAKCVYSDLLVGSTGFVGGNLMAKHKFTAVCHSSDVAVQYGTRPDLCVYAGVPAAMFLANADPEADLAVMRAARENLQKIAPKELVLISSIAVYADSRGKNEDEEPDTEGLSAYGRNRLQLEHWVREDFPDALIVRLPALYGQGLKRISSTICAPSRLPCSNRKNTTNWRKNRRWCGMATPWPTTASIS